MSGKPRLPTGPRGGPFLQAALLCEKVLLEPDGTATAVRIIDQVTVQRVAIFAGQTPHIAAAEAASDDLTSAEPSQDDNGGSEPIVLPAVLSVSLLVIFKSGDAPGNYVLAVVLRPPDGNERPLPSQEIELSAVPHGGATHVHQLNLGVEQAGNYRFDVSLDGQFVTSIPLRVDFAPSS
jgi:hypothetical protein